MTEEFDIELFLKGGMVDNYFEHNKRGDIIPSSFDSSTLSKDIRKAFTTVTMEDNLDIYVYENKKGHYEPHGKHNLRVVIKKALSDYYEEKFAKATIDDITASTTKKREELEPPLNILAFENGLLNIEYPEPKLVSHTPAMFFTSVLPVEYKPNTKEPKVFLRFLEQILPSEIERMRLQEHVGNLLFRRNIFEIGVLILGPEDSGKSTFLNVLGALLGEHNVTNITLQELVSDKFASAQLYHKFAMLRSETPRITIRHSGLIKSIITGDSISAQFKYGKLFDYRPHAKIWIGANEAPYTKDVTKPFFKRWDIFEFPNQFQGKNCDRFLIDKLTTKEELAGILNWALVGLKRLLKNKEFTGLKTIPERKKMWLLSSSSLYKFCKDCVEEDIEFWEQKDYFNECYFRYCGVHDLNTLDRNVIAKELPKLFPKVRTYKPKIDDKQVACWKGIRIVGKKQWEA